MVVMLVGRWVCWVVGGWVMVVGVCVDVSVFIVILFV